MKKKLKILSISLILCAGFFVFIHFNTERGAKKVDPLLGDLLNVEKIPIVEVSRNNIKPPFGAPEDKGQFIEEEKRVIDHNFNYAEPYSSFFSSRGEEIYYFHSLDLNDVGSRENLIVTNQIGSVHQPNYGYVVKDGVIIASIKSAYIEMFPSPSDKSFYVRIPDYSDAPMCCPKRFFLYKVHLDGDVFKVNLETVEDNSAVE
jgi:hypothetical protein